MFFLRGNDISEEEVASCTCFSLHFGDLTLRWDVLLGWNLPLVIITSPYICRIFAPFGVYSLLLITEDVTWPFRFSSCEKNVLFNFLGSPLHQYRTYKICCCSLGIQSPSENGNGTLILCWEGDWTDQSSAENMTGFLGVVVVVAVLTFRDPAPGHRRFFSPQTPARDTRIEFCVKPWPDVAGMVVVKINPQMGQKERA